VIGADNSKASVIQSAKSPPLPRRNFTLRVRSTTQTLSVLASTDRLASWDSRAARAIGAAATLLALANCGGPRADGGVHATTAAAQGSRALAVPSIATEDAATAAEIARIQAAVASLRGLPFRAAVPSTPQSRDEFRQFVREDLAHELGPDKNAALSKALAHTGFLPRPLDFAATLEEAETTQVAAYYDPRTGRFHTVTTTSNQDERDGVVAHELTHALQHQYFDLIAYDGGTDNQQNLSDDERAARRYIVEGEATFVMLAYQSASGSGSARHLGPLQVAGVRMTLTMLSAVDYVELLALVRTGEETEKLDDEAKQSLDELARLPPLVAVTMVDPYIRGAFLVSEAWARGGWARVARLYHEPPQSTEQVLHPIEKLFDRRDPPIAIRLSNATTATPRFSSSKPLLQETAGELDWRCYFKTWSDPDPEGAADGWGGDLVTVWERGGQAVAAIATRWDTPADAAEFEGAYRLSLSRRFEPPAAKGSERATAVTRVTTTAPTIESDGATRWTIRRPDGTPERTWVVVRRRGLDVDILDGARSEEVEPLLAMLRAAERKAVVASSREKTDKVARHEQTQPTDDR
jgi:hypothetical protein